MGGAKGTLDGFLPVMLSGGKRRGYIYSFEPSPFPREGAEGLGLSSATLLKYVETEGQNLETTFGIHHRRMVR